MPGFDGTGPFGQGPMTGRGRGFCVLANSEENPNEIQGFAGIDGKPFGKMNEGFRFAGKEVIDMPFGDGTGPAGMGPMTGRAAGFCAGYPVPGYMNPVRGRVGSYGALAPGFAPYSAPAYGYGVPYAPVYAGWGNPWLRRGFGFGRGFGRGRRWGRGRGRFGYW
jgi:hypothetical protein